MNDNPYSAPQTPVMVQPAAPINVPKDVHNQIRNAYIAATISGTLTTLFAVTGTADFEYLNLFDAALVFGLAFGIYKRSRACAVLMFVYFVANKLYLWSMTEQLNGLVIAVFFAAFYFQGIRGTFAYHRLKAKGWSQADAQPDVAPPTGSL